MKKLFKFLEPILVGLGAILVMDILIFPGLSAADTIVNILSFVSGIALWYFVFMYVRIKLRTEEPVVEEKPKRKPKQTK
jgi:hypothetical protein